jgi:DNA-damage-inducible protein J
MTNYRETSTAGALDFFTFAAYVSQLRYEEDEVAGSSSMLHVRIDDEVKKQATEALAAMGLSASDAVRLLFHRVVADQAFPLELKVPNAATREAMAEADSIVADRRARFADGEALIGDLDG